MDLPTAINRLLHAVYVQLNAYQYSIFKLRIYEYLPDMLCHHLKALKKMVRASHWQDANRHPHAITVDVDSSNTVQNVVHNCKAVSLAEQQHQLPPDLAMMAVSQVLFVWLSFYDAVP